jgi:hypothetical protein
LVGQGGRVMSGSIGNRMRTTAGNIYQCTKVYPKVSGLAAWSENCKWYSSLPLGVAVSLFVSQSSEFYRHNPFCCFSTSVYCCKCIFRCRLSPGTFGHTLAQHLQHISFPLPYQGQ